MDEIGLAGNGGGGWIAGFTEQVVVDINAVSCETGWISGYVPAEGEQVAAC